MNQETPKGSPSNVQLIYMKLDELNSRIHGQLPEGNDKVAEADAIVRIEQAADFLDRPYDDFQSEEECKIELRKILRNLDVAILTINEPYAHDLRNLLIEKFGPV